MNTGPTETDKSFILIDNGLLRKIYAKDGGDVVFSRLYSDSKKNSVPDLATQEAVVTPFSLLEAIGYGEAPSVSTIRHDESSMQEGLTLAKEASRQWKQIAKYQKKVESGFSGTSKEELDKLKSEVRSVEKRISELVEKVRTDLYSKYFQYFSGHESLQPGYLQKKYDDQFTHLSGTGQEAFRRFFSEHIRTTKDVEYISQFLAFDAVYKLEWQKELRTYRDTHIFADLYHTLKDDKGVMQTRGLKYAWLNFSEEMLKRKEWARFKMTEEEFRKEISDASSSFDLKTREDLVDTEMLQFLITGKLFKGRFSPVYVYTMETQEKFLHRVALMKTIVNSVRELVAQWSDLPSFAPGVVTFTAENGAIERIVQVIDITPVLADRS